MGWRTCITYRMKITTPKAWVSWTPAQSLNWSSIMLTSSWISSWFQNWRPAPISRSMITLSVWRFQQRKDVDIKYFRHLGLSAVLQNKYIRLTDPKQTKISQTDSKIPVHWFIDIGWVAPKWAFSRSSAPYFRNYRRKTQTDFYPLLFASSRPGCP